MLSFRTPELAELGQRQTWLSDPDFMSYNAGWEIDHPSYDPAPGCIVFPPEQWGRSAAERIHLNLGFRVVSTEPGERVVHTWDLGPDDPSPSGRPSSSTTSGST